MKTKNIIFILMPCLFLISCDKPELYTQVVTKIEAKVENASKYSNVVEVILMAHNGSFYEFVELARGDWNGEGFSVELPEMVDTKYLHSLINVSGYYMTIINPPSTVSISNKNVKVDNVAFFGVDKDDNVVTRFYPIEIDNDGYGQDVYCTYVDSDVTISGYTKRKNDTFAWTEYDNARYSGDVMFVSFDKITTNYSIKWEKGWNVWTFSRFGDTKTNTATEKWAPATISRIKWYSAEDLWTGNRNQQMSNH